LFLRSVLLWKMVMETTNKNVTGGLFRLDCLFGIVELKHFTNPYWHLWASNKTENSSGDSSEFFYVGV
jgi:hypothetical protein